MALTIKAPQWVRESSRAILLAPFLALCLLSYQNARADNDQSAENIKLIKQGRAKAQGCTRCHGRAGMAKMVKRANWSGSVSAFVTKELVGFRDKQRSHEIMNAVASVLSDDDIYKIALWYESVSPKQ